MPNKKNLIGQKFNRLLVISEEPRVSKQDGVKWKCLCDCGNQSIVRSDKLTLNLTKSCGCLEKEKNRLTSIQEIILKLPINSKLTPLYRINTDLSNKHKDYGKIYCRCICGNFKSFAYRAITSGNTVSCGCHARQLTIKRNTKFNNNNSQIYSLYRSMIARCYTKTKCGYKNYFLKGVKVCDEWKNNYQQFLDWCLTNGWKPGLQLDKDIKGNGMLYSPDTCVFVTPRVNTMARPKTRIIIHDGVKKTVQEVARESGVSSTTMQRRIKNGWNANDAATIPANRNRKYYLENENKYNKKLTQSVKL